METNGSDGSAYIALLEAGESARLAYIQAAIAARAAANAAADTALSMVTAATGSRFWGAATAVSKASGPMEFDYERLIDIDDRRKAVKKAYTRHPHHLAVVAQFGKDPAVWTEKFIVPEDLCWGQFFTFVRRRTRFPSRVGLFIYADGETLPSLSSPLSSLDPRADGVRYVLLLQETTFGSAE